MEALEARIFVTKHAADRARDRLGYQGTLDEIRRRIRAEVRAGLFLGRHQTTPPPYVHNDPDRTGGCLYVRDADGTIAWVVLGQERLVVKTVLTGQTGQDDRRVRTGYVRT